MYEDSYGRLCLAQSQGNAAESLAVLEGTTITVRRASAQRLESGPPGAAGTRRGDQAAE
jgi:hypothetical protein